jgi:S1-C subfamily serine protease
VDEAVGKFRAIIGPTEIPFSEPVAQEALRLLHEGEVPSPDQLAALAIVIRLMRPVVFSRGGTLDDLPKSEGHNLYPDELKDVWSSFKKGIGEFLGSVGRIESRQGAHIGTGFLVRSDLICTNRHVLGAMTYGSEVLAEGASRVVFKQEAGSTNQPTDIVTILGVAAIHPTLDMVLLTVRPQTDRYPVVIESASAGDGERVAVIGYPADDPVNNPLFLASVFEGKFGVKRAALGEVLDGTESPVLFHDSSTTQGNSGSPIFSLKSAKVAGIHRAGFFMYRNEAVEADKLREFINGARS